MGPWTPKATTDHIHNLDIRFAVCPFGVERATTLCGFRFHGNRDRKSRNSKKYELDLCSGDGGFNRQDGQNGKVVSMVDVVRLAFELGADYISL
ncbi:hypothetical protein F2Q69_00028166 [Brassica cretica]|uniref:Uncharacterized protein n=1 Tax=Brassica cretica TaxID=69181 RepID=A0A8S9SB29_BRACR|nr:hypothetical protein F2Q69_00028166 [Brassica cretica]